VFDKPPFRLKPAFPIVVRKLRVVGDQLNGRSTGDHTIDWSYYWFPDSFHWKKYQLAIFFRVSEMQAFLRPRRLALKWPIQPNPISSGAPRMPAPGALSL